VLPVERVLNEEQRAGFRAELESQREHLREVNEKASTLRRELDEALFADKLDEQSVRDKSAALAEVETERSLIRARALAKVRSSLSESQLERLRNLRAEMSREGGGPGEGFRGPVDPDFRRGPGEADRPPGDRPDRGRNPRRPGGAERIERDPLPPPAPPPPPPPPPPR
jgi:hypothetical protein